MNRRQSLTPCEMEHAAMLFSRAVFALALLAVVVGAL